MLSRNKASRGKGVWGCGQWTISTASLFPDTAFSSSAGAPCSNWPFTWQFLSNLLNSSSVISLSPVPQGDEEWRAWRLLWLTENWSKTWNWMKIFKWSTEKWNLKQHCLLAKLKENCYYISRRSMKTTWCMIYSVKALHVRIKYLQEVLSLNSLCWTCKMTLLAYISSILR